MSLTEDDLKVGCVYRAKRYREFGFGNNNRRIVWMSNRQVQYNSDTVKIGRRYPIVDIDKFLKWAKEKVTDN